MSPMRFESRKGARVRFALFGALAAGCSTSSAPSSVAADAGPPSNHALVFNGTTDYGQAGTAHFVSSSSPQTVSMWVWYAWADADADADADVDAATDASASESSREQDFVALQKGTLSGLRIGITGGALDVWRELPANELLVGFRSAALPSSAGTWHHVAYVLDRSDAGFVNALYVDGQEAGKTTAGPNNLTPLVFLLGVSESGGVPQYTNYFAGYLDEIRVWTVGRTAQEIQAEMNGEVLSVEPGLVAYFNCNEILDGGLLLDMSGNGNNALLGGGNPASVPTLIPSDRPQPSQ